MSRLAIGFVFSLILSTRLADADTPLNLADLESYRLALASKPDDRAPLVGFRELWDHPEAHLGRTVRIEGRVARIFRQPRVGDFPPLAEAWVVSPVGDPFCLVFPQGDGRPMAEIGSWVRFSGTFLKRIKYHGADAERLAPLIVGPSAPSKREAAPLVEGRPWSSTDWMMAVGASMVVALILAGRHFVRPDPLTPAYDPPPIFLDGERGTDPDETGDRP